MRSSTASTGLSASRKQPNVSMNVEIIQKVLPGLSVPIQTASMNISGLSSLRSKGLVRAGTSV